MATYDMSGNDHEARRSGGDRTNASRSERHCEDAAFRPLRALRGAHERMSRGLDRVRAGAPRVTRGVWSPSLDVGETVHERVFQVDLPGVPPEAVSVTVVGYELRIGAESRERLHDDVVRRETRRAGRFELRSALPREADLERIEAGVRDGVLTVRVPKLVSPNRRRIEVAGVGRPAGPACAPGAAAARQWSGNGVAVLPTRQPAPIITK